MAGLLHGCARTTPCVRAELQASQASTRALAARYGLNPKTVAKWRERSDTADAPMGPRRPRSTVLTEAEEAAVVEFRRRTLLPLDDVLGCLRESIPRLTRSALHRCLERHGISRLPRDETASSKRKRFAETRIGYVHVDSCELRSAEGKVHMFLAIDRVSKFAYVELHATAEMATGAAFMRGVVAAFPYRIHTVLTDNGVAFTRCAASKWDQDGPSLRPRLRRARHQAQAHQALPSLDQRPGRADEPDGEGGHRQDIPLRDLGESQGPPASLPGSLQLRQAPQGAAMADTLSGRLRRLARTTRHRSRSTRTTSSRDHTPNPGSRKPWSFTPAGAPIPPPARWRCRSTRPRPTSEPARSRRVGRSRSRSWATSTPGS